jgi:hypothetical protein
MRRTVTRSRPIPATLFLLLAALTTPRPAAAVDDEIHWTMTGPASVVVDWRGSSSTLRYGPTSAYGLTATAATPSPLPFSSAGPFREVHVGALVPGTTYHYSIGTGPDHTFHTLPAVTASYVMYAEGDVGDKTTYPQVGPVQTLVAGAAPSFVLVVGDLTYGNDNGQAVVDRHFNDVMPWSQDAAYMPIWGNHEWSKTTDDFRNYKGRFELPNPQTSPGAPSAGCCGEDWYWFDAGTTRFIAYPEPYSGAWADWRTKAAAIMDAAQANPALRFIVTFGHRPAYSSGFHSGDATLASYMDALGTAHSKYVLNINGHSHNYERSFPQHGVIHVTAGTGGSTLEESGSTTCMWSGGCPKPSWCAYRAFHHGALRLTITPTSIRGDAICGPSGTGSNANDITCTSGSVFDTFQIGTTLDAGPPVAVSGAPFVRAIYPNPAFTDFTVAYELGRTDPAMLEVLDAAGRVVMARDLDAGAPGSGQAVLRRTAAMTPGVYWLRLSQAGRSSASRVVFMR